MEKLLDFFGIGFLVLEDKQCSLASYIESSILRIILPVSKLTFKEIQLAHTKTAQTTHAARQELGLWMFSYTQLYHISGNRKLDYPSHFILGTIRVAGNNGGLRH